MTPAEKPTDPIAGRYPLLSSLQLPDDIPSLSYEELATLADETRQVILDVVSANGGHLAPSLGVVELTIAMLRLCNPLEDRIIWDVGHQSYSFKVLTDRLGRFHTLRTYGGVSGFSNISESPYDAFGVGHSSTSISAGLGIACADELLGRSRKVIAVIGDGALSGGMAFEALNNLGSSNKPMVIVLNDNEMSISKNVGAMSASLSRIMTGELGAAFRQNVRAFLNSVPWGEKLRRIARKFEESALSFFTPGILFEELGLRYIGPIDGHDIKEVEKALNVAFSYNSPVLVHVATIKGKGYEPAELQPGKFHGISAFDLATGEVVPSSKASWNDVFGAKLMAMAEKDSRIVAITAAMGDGTGLKEFSEKFPERFFDVGIAEQHAVTFAAGMATTELRPYVAVYSTFLQRAFDQIVHDVALQNLPVRICVDRAGLVGQDGATHQGTFDISFLRIIPNLAIFLPRDGRELEEMLELSLDWAGPVALRYARGVAGDYDVPRAPLEPMQPEVIYGEGDYAIVSVGHIFNEALAFYDILNQHGHSAKLINLRFVPFDKEALLSQLNVKAVYTFEENVRSGGVGEMIAEAVHERYSDTKVQIMALPDEFVSHGTVSELRKLVGLTAEHAWALFHG